MRLAPGTSPGDPEPVWHQFAELPRTQAVVTEFQGHAPACPCCGHVTREAIPAEVRGPRLRPASGGRAGLPAGQPPRHHRGLEEISEVVFGVPLSGQRHRPARAVGRSPAPAHQEIAEAVPRPRSRTWTTGWKQDRQEARAVDGRDGHGALFVIHLERGARVRHARRDIGGLVCSDRWSAYHLVPVRRRQVCWAHLRRDFQAMIDRGGPAAAIGQELLDNTNLMFGLVQGPRRHRRGAG